MGFKISLAGDLGSGKSTVSHILCDLTDASYRATGLKMRALAAEHGMSINDFNVYTESHPEIDRAIDDWLVSLTDDPASLIIDSRMAWHFTKGTFRVYMTTEPRIAAKRILEAGRATEQGSDIEEMAEKIVLRRASEKKRYQELYAVDITDFGNYDLIVDTSYATPAEVAGEILRALVAWSQAHETKACTLCPSRIYAACEGEEGGEPTVFFEDSIFHLTSGVRAARAALDAGLPYVACRLVAGVRGETQYERLETLK